MDVMQKEPEIGSEAGTPGGTDALASRWRSGEPGAFGEAADRFQGPLLSYVLSLVRHIQDAEDVVQETLMRADRSVRQLQEAGSLWGWLRRIAHNAAVDAAKRSRRRGTPTDPAVIREMGEGIAEEESDSGEPGPSLDAIVRAIESLPDTYREAAVYHYLEEWPYAKIAVTLGIHPAAARQRVSRAAKMLRTALITQKNRDSHDM